MREGAKASTGPHKLQQGLLPDAIIYNAWISACKRGTLPQRALQLRESMLRQGLLPDVIIYNAWISACKRARYRREPCSSESQCYAKASCQT